MWPNLCPQEPPLPSWLSGQTQPEGAGSSAWAGSKGSPLSPAQLGPDFFVRQNWKLKCFIAEDPGSFQAAAQGLGVQSPTLWRRPLGTETSGTSAFRPHRRQGSAGWGRAEAGRSCAGGADRVPLCPTLGSGYPAPSLWEPKVGHRSVYSTEGVPFPGNCFTGAPQERGTLLSWFSVHPKPGHCDRWGSAISQPCPLGQPGQNRGGLDKGA